MIKKLLTIAAVVVTVSVNAQSNGRIVTSVTSEALNATISTAKSTSAPGCATISVINPTANVSLYTAGSDTATPGCSPKAGYVFGNNCYGDKEKATFYNAASIAAVTNPSITSVDVAFYRNTVTTRGTHGTTGIVGVKIYGGTSNTIAPTTAIVTKTVTLGTVIAAQTGTSSLFVYTFTFAPTAIPSTGFFASLVLPTTQAAGDTAVAYTQTSSVPNAWEMDATSTWGPVNTNWGINSNMVYIPVVCGSNIATGVSKNLGLSKDVKIMPNPSTGLVNVAITLAQTENISLTITNALGQQVLSNKYDGISNELISLDLTSQSNGVYFVTVSNGKDKMVQRLILNK